MALWMDNYMLIYFDWCFAEYTCTKRTENFHEVTDKLVS